MTDSFIEGMLFAVIVYLAIYAVVSKPEIETVCFIKGNPGSYVCE